MPPTVTVDAVVEVGLDEEVDADGQPNTEGGMEAASDSEPHDELEPAAIITAGSSNTMLEHEAWLVLGPGW